MESSDTEVAMSAANVNTIAAKYIFGRKNVQKGTMDLIEASDQEEMRGLRPAIVF